MGHASTAAPRVGPVRPATRADAPLIARLADMAGEGLPAHLWSSMSEAGQDPFAVGAARAARDEGAFSWRNARVAALRGTPVGVAIAYDLGHAAPGADAPPLLRPLAELEWVASGTRYLNVLAVLPAARRRGVARTLLADAARTARALTLTVSARNLPARALYLGAGFEEVASRPMGPGGPPGLDGEWILMRRPPPTPAPGRPARG